MLLKNMDYTDFFSVVLGIKLYRNIQINKHFIKMIKSKQLFHEYIYRLSLIKLEMLKTFIETYLTIGFI